MTEQTQNQIQLYVDSAKLDMLEFFQKPQLGVYEFRKLADICDIMINLCDAASAGFISPQAIHTALWASEVKAPTLHKALGGHVFDADELLKIKYETMARAHEELRLKMAYAKKAELEFTTRSAHLAAQIEEVSLIEGGLIAERKMLGAREADLERRELALAEGEKRLRQLSSGDATDAEISNGEEQGDAP